MLSNIFNRIYNTNEKITLINNYLSLFFLQLTSYLLPLITFPYLVRVVGIEYFGLLAFASATVANFNIITDYGFVLTATRDIAVHRADRNKVIEIFSSVMTIKLILMCISFVLLTMIVCFFDKFSSDILVYLLTFGTVIGQTLFPVWFFQGMERMKYITVLNILAKITFTIAVFVFVKEKADYYLVPMLTAIGSIVAGGISLVLIKKDFGVVFKLQKKCTLKKYLMEGWQVFASRFYVNFYTSANIFLLGLLTNNTLVGQYSIATKIIDAAGAPFEPANQTIYPYLTKIYKNNHIVFIKTIKKISYIFLILSSILAITIITLKNEIVYIVNGSYNPAITSLLVILAIKILINPFGALFTNSLIIMRRMNEFMKGMHYTIILNFLIVPISIIFYAERGLAVAGTIVCVFPTILYLIDILKINKESLS